VAVVQYTFAHKQYTGHKTNNTWNNTKILKECGPCPVFAGFTLAFALQLRKNQGKTSVGLLNLSYMFRRVIQHVQGRTSLLLAQSHGRNMEEAFETLYIFVSSHCRPLLFLYDIHPQLDVHGFVRRNINLIERTNKMQPCSRIYYSNVS
jgi:hypothetical protein